MAKKPTILPRKPSMGSAAAQRFLEGLPVSDNAAPPVTQLVHLSVEPSDVGNSEVENSNCEPPNGPAGEGEAKAKLTIAKPPSPVASDTSTRARVLKRVRDGRRVRQTTVYLDVALAKKLAYFCVDTDTDQSQVINSALGDYLSARS